MAEPKPQFMLPSDLEEQEQAKSGYKPPTQTAEKKFMLPSDVEEQEAAKEAARPSQNPLVEGYRAGAEALHGANQINPFSAPEGVKAEDLLGPAGVWKSFKNTGSGLLSALSVPFAPFVGAGKSVLAHATAPALRGAEQGIKSGIQYVKPDFDPKIQTHQEAYEALLPGAEAAISAFGPKRLPSGAIAPIAPVRKAPSGGLATKGGQETLAGKMLEKAATDPEAAIGAIDASKEIVPGSKPTTFQATGDLGLGQMERVVQNTPEGQAAFQQRWAEQNNARVDALRSLQQPHVDPLNISSTLRTAMEADDTLGELELIAARARAEQQSAALGADVTPEISGQIMRRELDMANAAARAEERRLWEGVDPNNQLFVNTAPVSNTQFRIYGEMSEAAAAGMTEPERTISGIISRYPAGIPFRDMRDLRSLVSTEMRKERWTNGETPTYARLTQLRGAIQESVNNPISAQTGVLAPDAAIRLANATAATAQRADAFKVQPVSGVLKRQGAVGPYDVTNAAVPSRFIPVGPKGYDNVVSYLRAVGNERGMPDIYDSLVSDLRSKAMNADGSINPDKLVRWAMSKQHALRAVTERDGGLLAQRLQNVEMAEQAILDIAAQRQQLAKLHQEGIFGKLIGADNPTDIQNILGGLFNRPTSVGDVRQVMTRLRAAPEAQMGARQAVVDWIWDKFISNTAAGTTEENIIRADQFQNFIRLKQPVLEAFGFTPDQISIWLRISDDMRQTKMSIDATKMRGGPGTAQDLNAMYQMREDLGQNLFRRIAYRLMAGSLGWAAEGPIGGAAAMFGAGVVSSMRDRGIKSVQDLVKNAMMNPVAARRLLSRVRGKEVNPWSKTWLGYEAAAQQQPEQPQPQGFKHGGTVRPLGREGIKARNKARAFEARERSSFARGAAQAKRKVKYADGGYIDEAARQAILALQQRRAATKDELTEGQYDRTARGGTSPGAYGTGFQSSVGELIQPGKGTKYPLRNVQPNTPGNERLGELDAFEKEHQLNPLEQEYHRSFGTPAGPETGVILGTKPYPVYADGGLTRGSEGGIGDAAALFDNNSTIAAMERMHQARKRAQGIDQPPPSRVDTAQTSVQPRFARGGAVNDDSSKATKTSVHYGKGMPKAHCGICVHFSKGTCSEVKGTIYASMWCELFKRKTKKYQEGGLVEEEDPLEAEKRRRNVPGGLSATAGPTVTSTTPVQDIPAPKVNKEGETLPTYVLKEMGKGLLGAPEQFTHAAGDLQRRGEYAGSHEGLPSWGPPPEEMPAGAAAALMLYGANAPFPKPGFGIFGGKGAKTANLPMLAEAERMLKEGVPHATIRNRTGWEFGSEGKPKFEISDAEARIKPEPREDYINSDTGASRPGGLTHRTMGEAFDHPAAYEAYPWLKDVPTRIDVGPTTKPMAAYTPPDKKYSLRGSHGEIEVYAPTYDRGAVGDLFEKQKYTDVGARDMLLHEMQHAIQNAEKFAPGANPRQLPIKNADIKTITQNMAKREGVDWDALGPKDKEMYERIIRHRIYKAQAGETEARNVQTRADSTLPSRPSWETEDIKRQNQMIDKGRRLKPGEKPFEDAKIYKSEYEDPAVEVAPAQEAGTTRAPEVPVLLGNPELRGSMSTLDNMPFTYRGKGPAEWTPQEFAEVGRHFGVERLGPESPPTAFRYGDGETFNVPGGLEGQFTYYDMLRMKADGIDPSRIPRELHIPLHQKLMRSMDVAQPVSPERTWSGLMFGMTSPNNPLFPNQLTQSILRMREPGLRQQLANAIPWRVGDEVPMGERLAASNRIASMLGIDAESKGGLGVRGSTDYTRIAELAQMWEKNPQWFTKTNAEDWPSYVERLTSQVKGTAMKTGSFGGVWQDPAHAGISAIDRHIVNEFERTGKLFQNRAEQRAFEKRAVERWNNNNEDRPVKNYRQLRQASGGEGFLTKMKLEYVGNEQNLKLRTRKGEINPNVPPHLANQNWPSEPSHVKVMGEAYRRALDWNQRLATQHGLNLFPSQWLEWDRIRRRFEPHENMFPGLERMPAMSREQLRKVSEEHTASGHKTYEKTEGEEGQMNLQPTRPRSNPAGFAYFTVPPVVGAVGALKGLVNEEE